MAEFQRGDLIDGRYELIERIGEGSFGFVFLAKQLSTKQEVAIKFLADERLLKGSAWVERARFRREMELIARLKHPHIVRLIDSGTVGDSIYTVLEYVKGETLFDRLQQLGTFDAVEAGRVMFQALEALANAHAEGVIHRDFKPQNVMLVPGAYKTSAMVLDFGVAGILKEARGTDYISLTAETEIHGTPTYMAPEQLRRAPLTPQSDIYSWGLVFIELLQGTPAVQGDSNFEVALRQVDDDPIPIPTLDDGVLEGILRKASAKPLGERYSDTQEVLEALDAWLASRGVGAQKEVALVRSPKYPFLGGLLFAIIAVAVFVFNQLNEPAQEDAITGCMQDDDCGSGELCRGECRPLELAGCELLEGEAQGGYVVGAIGPWSQADFKLRLDAIALAFHEVNQAGGLGNGQHFSLLACDDRGLSERSIEAAEHLADLKAPFILGPCYSDGFIHVLNEVSLPNEILTLGFSVTSTAIGDLNDGELAWRTVPSDRLQARGIAALLQAKPKPSLALVQDDIYGNGLLTQISEALPVDSPLDAANYQPEGDLNGVLMQAYRPGLERLVLLGSHESFAFIRLLEQQMPPGLNQAAPEYLLSDGGLSVELLKLVKTMPQLAGRIRVVGPFLENDEQYQRFTLRMKAAHGGADALWGLSAAGYDAAYIGIYALAGLEVGDEPKGAALAQRIQSLGEGKLIRVGPADFGRALSLLQRGASIDLEGVSGALDFDMERGVVGGELGMWRVVEHEGEMTFELMGRFDTHRGQWALVDASL